MSGGKILDSHRTRLWKNHCASPMHTRSTELFQKDALDTRNSFSVVTQNFFQINYTATMFNLAYRQSRRFFAALYLCGFPIGNQHHSGAGAAACRDTMYDVGLKKLKQFIVSFNPCTLRPRRFFTTADKGTEVNQRQVINLHAFDIDGRLKKIHGAAHLINEIPVFIEAGDEEMEESTAKALLEHHYSLFEKLGLIRSYAEGA